MKNVSTAVLAARYVRLNAYTRAISFAEHILNNKSKLIFSIILIFALITAGVSSYFIIELTKDEGETVVISINGETVAEYSLDENGEYILNGGTNILVIENRQAYIKNADCPDKLCVHQGKISKTGERIVCLPNRLMAEIFGSGGEIFKN